MEEEDIGDVLTPKQIKRLREQLDMKSHVAKAIDKICHDMGESRKDVISNTIRNFDHSAKLISKKVGDILAVYSRPGSYANSLEWDLRVVKELESDLIDKILISIARIEDKGLLKGEASERAEKLLKVCPEVYTTADELNDRLNELRELNVIYATKPAKASGRMLQETWNDFSHLLDDTDHYAMGSLAFALRTNKSLEEANRYHDNLDVMVNEDYIDNLIKEIKKDRRYQVSANLNHKGEFAPTFIVKDHNGSNINLYLFDRSEENGTICFLSYFREGKDLKCHYEEFNESISSYAFNDKDHAMSINLIYALKSMRGLAKDRYDMRVMKESKYIYPDRVIAMVSDIKDSIIGKTSANSTMIERISRDLYQNKNNGYRR